MDKVNNQGQTQKDLTATLTKEMVKGEVMKNLNKGISNHQKLKAIFEGKK